MTTSYRFDPAEELTPAELTQVLRELLSCIPVGTVDEMQATKPTIASHLQPNEDE